jgi:hypothetical protein
LSNFAGKSKITLSTIPTISPNIFNNPINILQTDKQNVLSGSNLVPSDYVSYSASTVKASLDSISSDLTAKAPISNPTFTGTISGITKSMIGLGNCDDTSDASKPVSTAQQTALDLKASLAAPTFTNYIQTPRIFEALTNSYTSFISNILTYDYANGSILYFDGLTSATNFQLVLTM